MAMIDFQYFFQLWVLPLLRSRRGKQAGQTAIEYLLMLALIAGMAVILGILFNRRLLGGFFSIVGMIIGEGLSRP